MRMDLRVDDSGDPVAQLRMLRNLQRAYDERDYETLAVFAPEGARDLYAALAASRRGDRAGGAHRARGAALAARAGRRGWPRWPATPGSAGSPGCSAATDPPHHQRDDHHGEDDDAGVAADVLLDPGVGGPGRVAQQHHGDAPARPPAALKARKRP